MLVKTIAIDVVKCRSWCIQVTCLCTAGKNVCDLKGPKTPGTNTPMNYSDMYRLRDLKTNNFLRILFHTSFEVRVQVSLFYKMSTMLYVCRFMAVSLHQPTYIYISVCITLDLSVFFKYSLEFCKFWYITETQNPLNWVLGILSCKLYKHQLDVTIMVY